jgi:COP9 signalosome complex subunit 1
MGNEDLGRHYYMIGELPESFKSYNRMRDYCTSPKHIADMCLRVVLVTIAQHNWVGASSQLSKIASLNLKPEERQPLEPIVSAVSGLIAMCSGNFREAAQSFLNTSYSFATAEPAAGIVWQKEVLTPNDVAVYGGLCALASMDRPALQKKVLDNAEFRQFLELEPHIRRAISLFCGSKYSGCLDVLEAYRTDYLLDLYLNPILRVLYGTVRTKSIVQYFIPYSCVSLDEMAKAFQSKEGTPLEDELKAMIRSGALNARIDLVDRVRMLPRFSLLCSMQLP